MKIAYNGLCLQIRSLPNLDKQIGILENLVVCFSLLCMQFPGGGSLPRTVSPIVTGPRNASPHGLQSRDIKGHSPGSSHKKWDPRCVLQFTSRRYWCSGMGHREYEDVTCQLERGRGGAQFWHVPGVVGTHLVKVTC